MKQFWRTWLAFGVALAVALSAMGWMTATALRLRRQATLEERVRLALWRMDSKVAPLVARENARPYFAYSPYYPAERAYNRMFLEYRPQEVHLPSPLLTLDSADVRLHFQFGPDGQASSPQVPTGNMRDRAEYDYRDLEIGGERIHDRIEAGADRLDELSAFVDREAVLGRLPREQTPEPPQGSGQMTTQAEQTPQGQRAQTDASFGEQVARARTYQEAALQQRAVDQPSSKSSAVWEGVLKPLWIGNELLLGRRVTVKGEDYVQGCWLDWPAIHKRLIEDVSDLLPEARLEPVDLSESDGATRMLATLPVRLVPGALPAEPLRLLSPVLLSLVIAWACVGLAAAAVGVVLVGALSLSERRGAFVSAVTHELRTPITTLQMYSEMLAEGMIVDDAKRTSYLATLRAETDRLGHLIENVLTYARLERGRGRRQVEEVALADLVARVTDRLAQRTRQAGRRLVAEAADGCESTTVRVDVSAVEQILLNLVDNACKYAASAEDARIHLAATQADGVAEIRVRDHGPGVAKSEERRLFRPFGKSARDAAHSAPGIGLGLALSRRLARDLGGDLRLDPSVDDGACFVLSLPIP
jgi:signal transduction histidine kinase